MLWASNVTETELFQIFTPQVKNDLFSRIIFYRKSDSVEQLPMAASKYLKVAFAKHSSHHGKTFLWMWKKQNYKTLVLTSPSPFEFLYNNKMNDLFFNWSLP